MASVKETLSKIEQERARRSVWITLKQFLEPLLPTDAVPRPKKGIKVGGTDQIVGEDDIRAVLEDVQAHITKSDKAITAHGKRKLVGAPRGKSKASAKK